MDAWHIVAERKIREAIEEGAFDHLEGAGKPLDLGENPFEDPSDRMAHRLLKNNGFAPAWIEEAKEIEAESRRLRASGEASSGDFQSRVAALNRRIALFNLKAPATTLNKRLFEISSYPPHPDKLTR
jgi:DnaJ-like protein